MKVNKSETIKRAWEIYKADKDCGEYTDMSCALSEAWREAKAPVKAVETVSIGEVKNSFWTGWKMVKAARYSNAHGSRERADDIFGAACKKLASFTESEIKKAFGKYADFAIAKVA